MKKDKLFNYLIYIFSFLIIVTLGIIIYINFIIKEYDVVFKINGASTLTSNLMTCKKNLRGCYVIMPKATRDNGKVLGYSLDKDDEKEKYQVGEKVYIKSDLTLYTISYELLSVQIDKNNVDYLEKNNISCNAYNENKNCKVTFPQFNKVGYQNAGYSVNKDLDAKTPSEYYPLMEVEIDKNMTVYPRYTSYRDDNVDYVYNNDNVYNINGSFIEFEKTLSKETIDMYKRFLDEISKNAPFLFVGEKINILSSNTFQKSWSYLNGKNSIVLGICYGSSILGYPLSRSIDVFYYSKYDEVDNYRTLVHEMAHAFDMYYGYAINKIVPNVIDEASLSLMNLSFDEKLNKIYGKERISSQKDILDLLKKYKNVSNRPIDNNGYAYTKNLEFVAEAVSWYYMKYLNPKGKYIDSFFPDDLRYTIENYICIAKNNYNKSAC